VAVLPFDNLSGDPDQEYFVDGMAEDLITRLSSVRSIPVIARNSTFVYKGGAVDVKQVSRELGARYVVEGSVRKAGDRVRISAQLIDGTTGRHVWADTYDRELRDVFALQDEITQAIVSSMSPELRRAELERAARREPDSLDAYESWLRGNWHYWKVTREHNAKARSFYERAVELDPLNAVAFSSLAGVHYVDLTYGWSDSRDRSLAEFERAARKCIELDDGLAGCHMALGLLYQFTDLPDKQIAAHQRAIDLNPSESGPHAWLGWALARAGKSDAAIASLEKAMRLSPRDPTFWMFLDGMAFAPLTARRYGDAIDWCQRSLQHRPDDVWAYRFLAASYAQQGRLEQAHQALEQALRLDPEFSVEKGRQLSQSADSAALAPLLEGLRKAGLREE
jgi:adenylate cyclase